MTDQKALEAAFAAWINNPKPDATVKELIAGAIAAYLAALPKPEGEAVALRYRDRANGPDERWTYMTLRSDSSKPGTIQEMVLRRADIYEVEFLGHPAPDAREAGLEGWKAASLLLAQIDYHIDAGDIDLDPEEDGAVVEEIRRDIIAYRLSEPRK